MPILHVLKSQDDELAVDFGHLKLLAYFVDFVQAKVLKHLKIFASLNIINGLDHQFHWLLNHFDESVIDHGF